MTRLQILVRASLTSRKSQRRGDSSTRLLPMARRMLTYRTNVNLMEKGLDSIKSDGPNQTVNGPIFEMGLGTPSVPAGTYHYIEPGRPVSPYARPSILCWTTPEW